MPAAAAFEFSGAGVQVLGAALASGAQAEQAVWHNPAGSARGSGWLVGSAHALLYPGLEERVSLNAVAAVGSVGGGVVQAGWSTLGAPDWSEQVAVVGYSRALYPRVALGASVRSSGWETVGLSRRVLSADLGATYEFGWVLPQAYLRLGAVVGNLFGANLAAAGAASGESPRTYGLGASLGLPQQEVTVDVERGGGRTQVRAAYADATPLARATFRVGGGFGAAPWEGQELDAGIDYTWGQWRFGYAYAYPLHLTGFGGIHQITIGYRSRGAGRGML